MLNALMLNADSLDERPPQSSLPHVWIGFIFAAAFLIGESVLVYFGDEETGILKLLPIALGGWIYWLFCVYRFHKVVNEVSGQRYPFSPGEAVGKHFIPFYNFFWIVRWPAGISDYIASRGRVTMVSGYLLGFVLLAAAMIGRFFDSAVGLAIVFSVGLYISSKLKNHIAALKVVDRDSLPPPPDKDLFGYVQNAPTQTTPILNAGKQGVED